MHITEFKSLIYQINNIKTKIEQTQIKAKDYSYFKLSDQYFKVHRLERTDADLDVFYLYMSKKKEHQAFLLNLPSILEYYNSDIERLTYTALDFESYDLSKRTIDGIKKQAKRIINDRRKLVHADIAYIFEVRNILTTMFQDRQIIK